MFAVMKRPVWVVVLSLALAACGGPPTWSEINKDLRAKFPSLRHITTQQLGDWLSNPKRGAPLLLDVRTEPEYAVSHLMGARRVDPDADAASALGGGGKNTVIVTYCSVGYRSSAVAERLQKAGCVNVYQLDGSIFQWANEGRPLVGSDGKKIAEVHPYNNRWGRLLDKHLHAKVAPIKEATPKPSVGGVGGPVQK